MTRLQSLLCLALAVLIVLSVPLCVFGWNWYKASIQREVWERQGVHLSTWEVMWGAKPVLTSKETP